MTGFFPAMASSVIGRHGVMKPFGRFPRPSCPSSPASAEVPGITEAECYLVSQIGAPIDRPHLTHVRVRGAEREVSPAVEHGIEAVVEREVAAIPCLWKSFLTQSIPVVG